MCACMHDVMCVYVYACTYVRMCVCVYAHMHVCMCVHMCARSCTCVHVCVLVCTYSCVYAYACTSMRDVCTYVQRARDTCMCASLPTYSRQKAKKLEKIYRNVYPRVHFESFSFVDCSRELYI